MADESVSSELKSGEKITSQRHLKALAMRANAVITARIAELAGLVADGLEGGRPTEFSVTLPASAWTDGMLTVVHDSFLADRSYCYLIYTDGGLGVKADDIAVDGRATFRCQNAPEIDLTAHIIRLEVGT